MPVVYFRPMGGNLAFIQSLDPTDPGYGNPIGGGHPGNALPGYGHPEHGLPGYGHPDAGLPGGGNYPGNRPPGSWGGRPDNSLPGGAGHPDNRPPSHPPVVSEGETLVLVRDPVGVWHYASFDASTPPPKPVPVPPPDYISNRPPGSGNYPSGQPVPPVPTPT